jgi:hypothetical protein
MLIHSLCTTTAAAISADLRGRRSSMPFKLTTPRSSRPPSLCKLLCAASGQTPPRGQQLRGKPSSTGHLTAGAKHDSYSSTTNQALEHLISVGHRRRRASAGSRRGGGVAQSTAWGEVASARHTRTGRRRFMEIGEEIGGGEARP